MNFGNDVNIIEGELSNEFGGMPVHIEDKNCFLLIAFSSDGDAKLCSTYESQKFFAPWVGFRDEKELEEFISNMIDVFRNSDFAGPYDLLLAKCKDEENCWAIILKQRETVSL